MKKYYSFILALVMAGCAKEAVIPDDTTLGLIPLNISSSITHSQTKVNADGFVDKDAIGLFAVNYINNNTEAGKLVVTGNQADNVKYVFDESSYEWTPNKSTYYKDVNTKVDLYLYYPYQISISSIEDCNFEVKKDQSAAANSISLSGYESSDFLWGKATDIMPQESNVHVSLNHILSAVKVVLVEKEGFENGEFESLEKNVIITNTTRKATINYAKGVAKALGAPQLDGIVMCPQKDDSFRAIVIPQILDAGTQLFSITVNGMSYALSNNSNTVEYQAGKQLDVTISISKKSPNGDYEFSLGNVQISDWAEDSNSHGGEARQYYVVNVEAPGLLGETIKKSGKNPAKIKNLKVTGQITSCDFDFMRDEMTILEAVNLKEASIVSANKDDNSAVLYDDIIPDYAFRQKSTLRHFSFPEKVSYIGSYAFEGTNLSGALIIPDDVTEIGKSAFQLTNIGSIVFPPSLKVIGELAFADCSSCSRELVFPSSLKEIRANAFQNCQGFSGHLVLPESLTYIGFGAFNNAGSFIGDLVIPASIPSIYHSTFAYSTFTGALIFEGTTTLVESDPIGGWSGGNGAFAYCHLRGELIIPEGTREINSWDFTDNDFTSIKLPNTLTKISRGAFSGNDRLTGELVIPEGTISIGDNAFSYCRNINSLVLPSTLQTIQSYSFYACSGILTIQCSASEPPSVQNEAFYDISKEKCVIQVPEQSVKIYYSEPEWANFNLITSHFDFVFSKRLIRTLNAGDSRVITLQAPAKKSWRVQSKPEWITVIPEAGIGKTDVTILIAEMPKTSDYFELDEGVYDHEYHQYKGRDGEIVFALDGKDYTSVAKIEQYDCDFADGDVRKYHTATKGHGIDVVFIGDGYDAKDIASGLFISNATEGIDYLFDLYPYKNYKDYFNIYSVISMSYDSGIGTLNTSVDTKFGSSFTNNRIMTPDPVGCFSWAKKANHDIVFSHSLVVMMMNTSTYEGVTMMYADGSAISCCPVSRDSYPYDYRGLIQHEAGGHGFGKLGDEYIYHNAYINNCPCLCCADHPSNEFDSNSNYGIFKSLGWFKNLSMNADVKQVPWAHLIYNPNYSDYVDIYEGGYMHSRGVYRSETTSCMNNNIPYYSAISRQAIVERIMECSGEEFTIEQFYEKDKNIFGTVTKSSVGVDRTFGVDPNWNRSSEHGSVIYMGEHPNVK